MREVVPVSRSERFVCAGRLVLALTTFLALSLDKDAPAANLRSVALTLSVAYAAYAVLASYFEWKLPLRSAPSKVASHVVDLVFIAGLNFVTNGTSSPFFVFFVFALFAASLRFGSRAVSLTALVLFLYYQGLAVATGIQGDDFDVTRFLIRSSYLAVVTVLLTYLTAHREKLRDELGRLAHWPRTLEPQIGTVVGTSLARAALLLDVPRVLLMWEDEEEPWVYVALHSSSGLSVSHVAPSQFLPIVDEGADRSSFLGGSRTHGVLVEDHNGERRFVQDLPVHPSIVETYTIEAVISSPFDHETVKGRVFFLDRIRQSVDDLSLAQVVAGLIGSTLTQHLLLQRLQNVAVIEERLRLARDLHDGILQSLTGAKYHLHGVHSVLENDPPEARRRLEEIQEMLSSDQRELRSYISQLRPAIEVRREPRSLVGRLQALAQRAERQWGAKVSLRLDSNIESISPGMHDQAFRIASEAVTNAAKHAAASLIEMAAFVRHDRLVMTIDDDGRGMSFTGRFELDALNDMKRGPITLKERVGAVKGSLVLESTPSGTRLEIELPISLTEVRPAEQAAAS